MTRPDWSLIEFAEGQKASGLRRSTRWVFAILIALIERNNLFVDVALGLGTLGFIGIVAYAKFAADQRMF